MILRLVNVLFGVKVSIKITVVDVYGLQARIGVEAPPELDILRDELYES